MINNLSAEALINASPDAVVVCDTAGVVSAWNENAVRLLGWSAAEAVGRTIGDLFVPPELLTQYGRTLRRLSTGMLPAEGQRTITIIDRDGNRKTVDFWWAMIASATENVPNTHESQHPPDHYQIVGHFRDLSHRDQLESRLARLSLESKMLDDPNLYPTDEESFESALKRALETLCEVTGWPVGHALLPSDDDSLLESSPVWISPETDCEALKSQRESQQFRRGEGVPGRVWESGRPEWKLLRTSTEMRTAAVHIPPSKARSGETTASAMKRGQDIEDPNLSADEDLTGSLPTGIMATYCLPIRIRRQVIAVLEFFCKDNHPPHVGLETLIKKLSRTLGHMIERREWQEERRRMAAIVESSYDAIISKDIAGIITSWNVGAEQLYGYTVSEALGKSVRILLPEQTENEENEVLAVVRDGQRLEQFEAKRRRSNGEEINVSLTVSPLRDASGRIVGTASIERDITRRKQAQFRLQEAIVAAEEANRTKSEFLANISHELRTPMNAILGMTRLSLLENLPETVRDYLTTARDSADTMLLLINDILDFSRLEANRFELDPAPFDVRHVIDETLPPLSLRAHEKGLELAARVRSNVPTRLIGDSMRVRQVLTNLISNAIKFTESGEVIVTVDMLPSDNKDVVPESDDRFIRLRFCVADTGIGIHPDDHERIFAPFTQVDASTTRTHPGTGLGLSICKDLARLMDGDVQVESALGKGSRFYFTARLPIADDDNVDEELTVDTAALANTPVLIVDDNETNRHFLKEMLESWSMQPVMAPSAEAALRELREATENGTAFPLLIVDAVMPNTDGLALLEQLQASTESSGATILMLSPADQKLFRERSQELTIDAVLPKPVSQSGLLNAICEVFGGASVLHPPEQQIDVTGSPLRILVAEDIAANRKVVEAILTKRGHTVAVAHNGREAIEHYQQQTFDVILMDVQMPIMDGLQAVRAIRDAEEPGKRIPIIAMTAHAMKGDREACLEAGMDAYISKPLDSTLLLQTLEQLAEPCSAQESRQLSPFRRSGTWRFRSPTFADSSSHPQRTNVPLPAPGLRNRSPGDSSAVSSTASTSLSESKAVWQPRVALRRMGEDQTLLQSMITYFIEDAPGLMQELPKVLASGTDAEEATRLAHSLKGLCSSFEATATVALAARVENACRERRLDDAAALLPELRLRIAELANALQAWQAQNS